MILKLFKNQLIYLSLYVFGVFVFSCILNFIILEPYKEIWFIIIINIILLVISLLGFLVIKRHFKRRRNRRR